MIMTTHTILAFDLGGTKLAGAILNYDGTILEKTVAPLEKRQGAAVGRLIQQQTRALLQTARQRKLVIDALGICVPGIARQKTGTVWAPNIPGWEDYPLRAELEAIRAVPKGRVRLDSDRACCILGEAWQGVARGCRHAIFLAVGTGIGAGILIDGEVLRGAHDIAGAIGWLALHRPYEKKYLSCGCFEHHASGGGIARMAKEFLVADKKYSGKLRKAKKLTAHDVFAAYKTKDRIAVKTLQTAVEFWGMAVANLVSLFNPEKIIFGGGVFGPAACLLPDIYTEAKKWAQPISIQQVTLEASALGGEAGLFGAGYLALRSAAKNR